MVNSADRTIWLIDPRQKRCKDNFGIDGLEVLGEKIDPVAVHMCRVNPVHPVLFEMHVNLSRLSVLHEFVIFPLSYCQLPPDDVM